MSVETRTIWNAGTASIGGSWHIDSLRGLLDGVIYIDREAFNRREPKELTLIGSRGTEMTKDTLDGATVGVVTVKLLDDVSTSTLVAYQVSAEDAVVDSEGLWQIDALYTESEPGEVDSYTKAEIDSKVSTINTNINKKVNTADVYTKTAADAAFVAQEASPKVQKATAGSSNALTPLATGATLEQVVTKVNEVIATLNTVRSTAGSAYTAANGLIDSLTTGKVMKA
ncbi:hypothetical protein [Pantoea phage vB_PagP-SK1]|uniref:Uncharacterized protein n=1 Tax=Pantoea phage vB_PagP-SK1 TaxID=2653646 RepID=A0A5P8NKC4_9CAUD|nr:hypothetical protein [Pantoea phage vB_PagP-SK1]